MRKNNRHSIHGLEIVCASLLSYFIVQIIGSTKLLISWPKNGTNKENAASNNNNKEFSYDEWKCPTYCRQGLNQGWARPIRLPKTFSYSYKYNTIQDRIENNIAG